MQKIINFIKSIGRPYYTFYSGTITYKEILAIFWGCFRFEPLSNGKFIEKLERAFAEYVGIKYSFGFAAGRMALYAILESLDIGPGDEVILPAYTCVVVPNAIIYRGAKPIFVDIERKTLNIDPDKIEEKIKPQTKAIIAQHTFGLPCDMDRIMGISKKLNIPVIEDCCLALGAEYKGKKVGSFGAASFFSFDSTKVINAELGGMAVTSDPFLSKKLKNIQSKAPFFSKRVIFRIAFQYVLSAFAYLPRFYYIGKYLMALWYRSPFAFLLTDENMLKKPTKYPYPARLSNLQAKIGLEQFKQIEMNIGHRIAIAAKYEKLLKNSPVEIINCPPNNDYKHIYLRFTVLTDDPQKWIKESHKRFDIGTWFDSIAHGKHEKLEEISYKPGSCPIGETVSKININFPTHLRIIDVDRLFKGISFNLFGGVK